MRCLYCGKELALLKRWTGGGEFCSDAHRQRYQEEYNQLALNRLLQAKPPAEPKVKADAKPAPAVSPFIPAESVHDSAASRAPVAVYTAPKPIEPTADPVVRAATHILEEPEVEPDVPQHHEDAAELIAPAGMAGFFVERPDFMLAEVPSMSRPDMELLNGAVAALPNHSFEPLSVQRDTYQLETAGPVAIPPSNRISNYTANNTRDRRLEVRDWVRTSPVVEFDLSPAGETGLETSSEAMDILIFPKPPQGPPVLWQQPPAGFSSAETELGALARLAFATTGFAAQDESEESERPIAVAIANPAGDVISEPEFHVHIEPEPVPSLAVAVEPLPEPVSAPEPEPGLVLSDVIVAAPAEAAPVAIEEPAIEPVIEEVAPPPSPFPDAVTKPLPLVLHVSAPGKGKPAQVFASAASAVDIQVPRSTSLPLRPLIVFGPAPVKEAEKKTPERPAPVGAKNEPTREPKKPLAAPVPVRSEKKAEPPVKEAPPALKQTAKAEVPAQKPPARADAKQNKKPEIKEPLKLKEDSRPAKAAEAVMPAPLAAPYPGSSDLGLPHLKLQSSPGFLGNLPPVAKIGIFVALVAVLGVAIAYSSKTGGAAVSAGESGTVVAGSVLPIGDGGWITDWGADPGVRRTRQISILRSSQTLTDYRIEMQGQIETKAIGWVFRAADPRNFYVTKLEIVKPGLEPTVALVRFAVINGEEQAHAQLPLPMKVRRDTMYKIRFDAVGSHFTTYVQDQKVDDWNNDSVRTGGVGLYSERGEVATLKGGMNVVPLIVRK